MAVTVIFWFYSGVTTIFKKNHFVSYHHHLSELLPSLSNFRKQISKQPSSISWRYYKGSLKMLLSQGQLSNFSYTYVWTEKIRKIDLACFYTCHVGMVVISVTIWLSPVLKGRKSVCVFSLSTRWLDPRFI